MAMKISFDTPDEVVRDSGILAADTPLRERIVHALRGVLDPELPVNIYDLGLIYRLEVQDQPEGAVVAIDMTLTAPNCPVAGEMPGMVRQAVLGVAGVATCTVALVWSPKWDRSRIPEDVRLELGLF